MKTPVPPDISANVMESIKSGTVRMKPRLYYTLLWLASLCAIVFAGLTTVYVMSIMFFWLRVQTADTMAYGARANLADSLASFPWWAPLLAVLLLTAAIVLVRRQGQMYRHKTSTVALVVIISSLLFGLGLSALGIGSSHAPRQFNGQGQGRHAQPPILK